GFLQRAPLVATIGIGAVEVVDLADAAAGELLDLAAQLDEGVAEILGQHRAERRLARAAQPDQRDAALAFTLAPAGAEQLGELEPRAPQLGLGAMLQQLADQKPLG